MDRLQSVRIDQSLYQRLLGSAWLELPKCIQQLHTTFHPSQAHGNFEVKHGNRWVCRMLARVLGLPRQAASIPITLSIKQDAEGENWIRRFGSDVLMSTQYPSPGQVLSEKLGFMIFQFNLHVENGHLIYHQRTASVRLGNWTCPLPGWISPRVSATEQSFGSLDAVEVSVEVTWAWWGHLLAYHGTIHPERNA